MATDFGVRTVGDLEPPGLLASREHEARMEVATALQVPVDEVDVEVMQVAGETRVRAYWLPT